MNGNHLLESKRIDPNMPVLLITAAEALDNIQEYASSTDMQLDLGKLDPQELMTLISSYGDCVLTFHPENNHPERAALLRNFKMLKRYGLEDDDFQILDFA